MLQAWLRELPEPLVRFDLYYEVLQSQQFQDEAERMTGLHNVLKKVQLPSTVKFGKFDAPHVLYLSFQRPRFPMAMQDSSRVYVCQPWLTACFLAE